jgi:hypothetical protein
MSCDLFERDGLLQLEQGVELDPHFATCPDCREARRVYAQLGEQIAELDSAIEPSPAWKARVWQRLDQQRRSDSIAALVASRSRDRRPSMGWVTPMAALVTLAIVGWIGWTLVSFQGSVPVLSNTATVSAEIYRGQASMRGDDAHPGDQLRTRAIVVGYEHAELRVYFNDKELLAQCSADTTCARQENAISMTTTMRSLGSYRPVLIVSNGSIPAAVAGLDQDAAAAMKAGAIVKASDPIPVR